jgi:hypothetical protein
MKKETVGHKLDNAIKAAKGKITPNLSPDDSPKATQAVLNLMQAKAFCTALQPTKELDEELGIALDRVRPNLHPTDMMKATQAVLNLMHAKAQATAQAEEKKQPATTTKTN